MRSFLLGAPVDGAFNIPFKVERGGGAPTARDYVQDGLIHMWDGIENAGWGVHDATATAWTDLIGGLDFTDVLRGAFTFGDDCIKFDTASCVVASTIVPYPQLYRVEMVYDKRGGQQMFAPLGHGQYATYGFEVNNNRLHTMSNRYVTTSPGKTSASFGVSHETQYSYQSTTVRPFVNGVEVAVESGGDVWLSDTTVGSRAALGRSMYASGFIGDINCIRIYSRELTDTEIAANYAVDKIRFNLP